MYRAAVSQRLRNTELHSRETLVRFQERARDFPPKHSFRFYGTPSLVSSGNQVIIPWWYSSRYVKITTNHFTSLVIVKKFHGAGNHFNLVNSSYSSSTRVIHGIQCSSLVIHPIQCSSLIITPSLSERSLNRINSSFSHPFLRFSQHVLLCILKYAFTSTSLFLFIMVIDFLDHAACSGLAMTVNSDKGSPLLKVAVFHPLHFYRVMCPLKLFFFCSRIPNISCSFFFYFNVLCFCVKKIVLDLLAFPNSWFF